MVAAFDNLFRQLFATYQEEFLQEEIVYYGPSGRGNKKALP
jgi:hypothetical protein